MENRRKRKMRKKSTIVKLVFASTWFSTRNAPTNSEKVCGTCSFELERDEVPIEVKIEPVHEKGRKTRPTDWYSLRVFHSEFQADQNRLPNFIITEFYLIRKLKICLWTENKSFGHFLSCARLWLVAI